MDAKSLSDLFQSGNWSLVQPALDQFNSTGEQAKANVAQTQALTNKTNTMLPYDVEHSKALTESARQQARTQQLESDAKEGVPLADRTNAYWSDLKSKMSDAQINQLNNNMEAMRYYANKPQWSLEDQTTMQSQYPGLMEQLSSPNGRKVAAQIYDDHIKHSGKYMTEEMKAKYHLQGVQTGANATIQAAGIRAASAVDVANIKNSLAARLANAKTPRDRQAAYISAAGAAEFAGDKDGANYYSKLAKDLDPAVAAQNGAVPKAGTVDKSKLGIDVNPVPSTMPQGQWTPPNGWK